MHPIPFRTQSDFVYNNGAFVSFAILKKQFLISAVGTFCHALLALTFAVFALALPTIMAEAAMVEEQDFAALQAETKKVFEDRVTPFFNSYCTDCHGLHRMEGGINFAQTLAAPGSPSSAKTWKQALANIKAQDMPPDDARMKPINPTHTTRASAIALREKVIRSMSGK